MIRRAVARTLVWSADAALRRRVGELDRTQWLDRGVVQERQLSALRALVHHCETQVPYYQRLFRSVGFSAGDLRSLADYARLPVLTKETLQEERDALIARNVSRDALLANHSGGSTGKMSAFYLDRHALQCARAAQWRFYTWAGLELGDPHVFIWGAPSDLTQARKLRKRIQNWILGRVYVDAFSLSGRALETLVAAIRRAQPRVLTGYASALGRFVEHCASADLTLPSLRGVVSTAEVLSDPLRRRIETVLKVPVLNRYGSGEMKDMAQDCGAGAGMHINSDNVLLEVADGADALTGGGGEIIATNLVNHAMPLLRYATGDLGEHIDGRCPCGRGLPLFRLRAGRLCEGVLSADGTWIHAEYFTHLFYGLRGVRQFQLRQRSLHDVEVRVRPAPDLDRDALARVRQTMEAKLPGARIELQLTDTLEPSPSGKFLFVMSSLSGSQLAAARSH